MTQARGFRPFADALPEPMLLVGIDRQVLAANIAARSLFNPVGSDLVALFADDPEKVIRFVRAASRTRELLPGGFILRSSGARCRMEGALLSPAGPEGPAQLLIRIVPDEAATRQFRHLNERITALHREIADRMRAETLLYEQREWLKTTLSSIGDAVIATDERARVVFMNPVAEALTGWPQVEAEGQQISTVFRIVNEDTREEATDPVGRVLREGSIVALANHTVLLRRDGGEIPIDDSGAPIRGSDDILCGAVLVFRDISQRRQAEKELRETVHALERSNRDLRQFAYAAAHDLKEPLRMVSLYSQLLSRRYKGQLDPEADEFLAHATEGAKHMHELVDDLFTFTQVVDGEHQIDTVDPCEVVARAIQNLEVVIAETGAVIRYDAMPAIVASCVLVELLFQNLIGNALKYRSPHTVPEVEIRAERKGQHVIFAVKDNGIGIDPRYHDQIFGIFKRLNRDARGTGMGLAICTRIVERYGGEIWLNSDHGKGATFFFTLPAAP